MRPDTLAHPAPVRGSTSSTAECPPSSTPPPPSYHSAVGLTPPGGLRAPSSPNRSPFAPSRARLWHDRWVRLNPPALLWLQVSGPSGTPAQEAGRGGKGDQQALALGCSRSGSRAETRGLSPPRTEGRGRGGGDDSVVLAATAPPWACLLVRTTGTVTPTSQAGCAHAQRPQPQTAKSARPQISGGLTRSRPPQPPPAGRRPKAHLPAGPSTPSAKPIPRSPVRSARQGGPPPAQALPLWAAMAPGLQVCVPVSPPTRVAAPRGRRGPPIPSQGPGQGSTWGDSVQNQRELGG